MRGVLIPTLKGVVQRCYIYGYLYGSYTSVLSVKIMYKSVGISLNRKPPIGGYYSKDYKGDLHISGNILYNILSYCCYEC